MRMTATVFVLVACATTHHALARSLSVDLAPTVPGKLTYFEGEAINLQLTLTYTPDPLQSPLTDGSWYLTGDYATDGSASVYWPLGPTNSSTFGSGNTRVINYSRTYLDEMAVNVTVSGYSDTPQITQRWGYEGFFNYRWFYNYADIRFNFGDSLSLQVLNANPVIDSLSGDMQVDAGLPFAFGAHASDPGINDVLTYQWHLDADGQYDDGPAPPVPGRFSSRVSTPSACWPPTATVALRPPGSWSRPCRSLSHPVWCWRASLWRVSPSAGTFAPPKFADERYPAATSHRCSLRRQRAQS